MYACIHAPGNLPLLIECARGFSPYIEETSPDTVVFDVRGMDSLYGPPAQLAREIDRRVGLPASISIAPNPDSAIHAARGFRGITVILKGAEAETLAPLPLNLLGGSSETAELLDLWGIRTFGDFAKLPPLGVAARLGDEGVLLQRLARGDDHRQLRSLEDALQFEESMELDHPVELLEPLSFVLARLLNDICRRLRARSLAASEIRLRLTLENAPEHFTALEMPVPMLDEKAFLKMLQLDLNARPPAGPILKVHLAAEPVKPRRTQQGLFLPSTPEPEKLELTIARIKHFAGADRAGAAVLVDTHRPDSFVMRSFAPKPVNPQLKPAIPADPRMALRRYRPPRVAQVVVMHQRPARITSPVLSGSVVMAKGPWRTSGDWWRENGWNRDEWDVEVAAGGLYRLFQELDSQRWFIEGSYD